MAFWRSVLHYDSAKVLPWPALRNALGVALPLAVGVGMGHATSGLIATTGALNVALSDGSDPYLYRLRRMLSASLFCGLAVFAGGLCGRNHEFAIALVTACAFAAGMMVAVGQAATDIANVTLVALVVFSAQGMTPQQAASSGVAALGGGLLQTALALALWPFGRYGPERRALAGLFFEIARSTSSGARAMESPPASAQATEARTALAALGRDRSIEAERYLALLSQAERIRLAILAVSRLRVRIGREEHTAAETGILDHSLDIAGHLLAAIGESLLERQRRPLPQAERIGGKIAPPALDELRASGEALRRPRQAVGVSGKAVGVSGKAVGVSGMLRDARRQLDALAGQLGSAWELAMHATPVGSTLFEQREAAQPWALRIGGALPVLRANLNLQSAVFRHALRLSACVSLAEVLGYSVGWGRSYWIPMTAAIVLRPDFTTTFSRGVLRVIGTLIGLGLATALFHMLSPSDGVEVALIALFAFLLRCFGPANYGIFVASLSALVVLMFAVTGVEPGPVIAARAVNTIAGGVLALAAYQVWPTWERTQVPEAFARMLDAYRSYFQVVRDSYLQPDSSLAAELDRARQAARLARSNAEASVARLGTEPGVPADRLAALRAMLANSHRFIHAVMSLEAGLTRSRPVPARAEFRTFANHVDLTLYYLAAALRGSPIVPADLPDLREDHYALVHAGDPHVDRYALVNVEADRIANSLNTLAEEVLAARGQPA